MNTDPAAATLQTRSHWSILIVLIIAAEMIFSLPFHVARYFRPVLLGALELDHATLGDLFAVYGVTALLAYFPGGVIANRYAARPLLVCSLLLTAAGGGLMLMDLSITALSWLYGGFGLTTILLFWAAMIKATRHWGRLDQQGRAFGFLDAGRGAVAAAAVAIVLWVIGGFDAQSVDHWDDQQRRQALDTIVACYSLMTALAGVLLWLVMDRGADEQPLRQIERSAHVDWRALLQPRVLALAVIVLVAYCGYKGVDYFGLYAMAVMHMSEQESLRWTHALAWIRPLAAIAAGVLMDWGNRRGPPRSGSRMMVWLMAAMLAAFGLMALDGSSTAIITGLLMAAMAGCALAIYAIRALYFALLGEMGVSRDRTALVVGLVSVIGFSPDIFMAPLAGRLLDAQPGASGLLQLMGWLALSSGVGVIAALWLRHDLNRKAPRSA